MLERGHHQYARVAGEYVFGAVAMVDIEIDDRHPLHPVHGYRMHRGNGDIVEYAKAHGPRTCRVVPGRAHAAESVFDFTPEHQVGRQHARSRGMQGGRQAVRVHRRIGIKVHGAGCRRRLPDGTHIIDRVHACDFHIAGFGGVIPHQVLANPGGDHPVFNRRETRGALRVMGPHVVLHAIGVRDECRSHVVSVARVRKIVFES